VWLWGRGSGVVALGSWLWGRGSGVVSYKIIFGQDFLKARDYEGAILDELTPKVQQKWETLPLHF